jgi:hypothetical protein
LTFVFGGAVPDNGDLINFAMARNTTYEPLEGANDASVVLRDDSATSMWLLFFYYGIHARMQHYNTTIRDFNLLAIFFWLIDRRFVFVALDVDTYEIQQVTKTAGYGVSITCNSTQPAVVGVDGESVSVTLQHGEQCVF